MSSYKQVKGINEAVLVDGVLVNSESALEVETDPGNPLHIDLLNVAGQAVDVGIGVSTVGACQRVVVATDDPNLAAQTASLASIDIKATIKSDALGIDIRKNQTGHDVKPVHMSGRRTGVTTAFSSIAFGHPALTRLQNTNNADIHLVSTSTLDDKDSGTGLREVEVIYYNNGGAPLSETIELDGQTPVTLAVQGNGVFSVVGTMNGTGHTNAGVVSVYKDGAIAGVPDDPAKVFAHMSVGRAQADQSDWHASSTENYYPVNLWIHCKNTILARLVFWDHRGVGFNNRSERVVWEALIDKGSHNIDLRALGPFIEGVVRFEAKADSGTTDISYVLNGYSDLV